MYLPVRFRGFRFTAVTSPSLDNRFLVVIPDLLRVVLDVRTEGRFFFRVPFGVVDVGSLETLPASLLAALSETEDWPGPRPCGGRTTLSVRKLEFSDIRSRGIHSSYLVFQPV